MGWWFGRKSAPADVRPFVPAWLQSDATEEGFARSREGITCYVRSTGSRAAYRDGGWEIGQVRGSALVLGGQQVVGLRAPAIAAASGGTIVDIEARVVIDQILAMLRQHGLIEP